MTLPFRRRHHDAEGSHDRARALVSQGFTEPLGDGQGAWLARHLETCAECRQDREAFLADRTLLRGLRDVTPEPPRDLWARTSAALQREAERGRRRQVVAASGRAATRDLWRGLPLGAAAGVLILMAAFGSSLLLPDGPSTGTPRPSDVAVLSPQVQPTPITLTAADPVGWMRPTANGRWELVISDVEQVCPPTRSACHELGANDPGLAVDLGGTPSGVTISPLEDQLVVESRGDDQQDARVLVVPVPKSGPGATSVLTPTTVPTEPTGTPAPPSSPEPPGSPDPSPGTSPIVGPSASPGTTPLGAIEIASGVTMVGDAAYDDDGIWLAFSARPADGSTGPDLYLWRVGDPAGAVAVTSDHRTYFSSWLAGQVLASRVVVPDIATPDASGAPIETAAPTPDPTASTPAAPAHPVSFLLDPTTGTATDLTRPDVWLPVVDPTQRFTAYWSGTLVPAADGIGWRLAEGGLVLDGWLDPASAEETPEPTTGPESTHGPDDGGSPIGPAGNPVALEVGDIGTFQAKFDPEGARLAVWTADAVDAPVGRLHLIVLDPESGTIDADVMPLPGAPALRRFSLDQGRLAWISPSGQDGQESAVQVLGWQGRNFGEIRTFAAKDLLIVR